MRKQIGSDDDCMFIGFDPLIIYFGHNELSLLSHRFPIRNSYVFFRLFRYLLLVHYMRVFLKFRILEPGLYGVQRMLRYRFTVGQCKMIATG